MILITGGTGKVGTPLVEQLAAAGVKFRVLARTPSKVKAGTDVEVVKGDLGDDAALEKALAGVDTLFLLTHSFPGSVALQDHVIDHAKAKGVRRVVRQSVAAADAGSPVQLSRWHWDTDQHLIASGLEWTLLRPGSFMQNLLQSASTIRKDGAFYGCAQDGKVCHIDARDIAGVAVKVLTSEGHAGQTYTLTGSEPLSYAQVAQRIGHFVGKTVKYVDLPPEQLKQGLISGGIPEWLATDYVAMGVAYSRGAAAKPTGTTEKLLGKARSFDDFLAQYGGAFR